MYLLRNSDAPFQALPGSRAAGWTAAIVGALYMATIGKRVLLRRTLVKGEPNCLRATAPAKGIMDPMEQFLTGDLSDLKMSIGAVRPGIGKVEWSEVVFSGSAGTIRMTVALSGYEDDYEERFAEWKRTMANSPD
jgi:hypothetical protein